MASSRSLMLKHSALKWLEDQVTETGAEIQALEKSLDEHRRRRRAERRAASLSSLQSSRMTEQSGSEDRGASAVSVSALEAALQELSPQELLAVQDHVLGMQRAELRGRHKAQPASASMHKAASVTSESSLPEVALNAKFIPRPESATSSDRPSFKRMAGSSRRPTSARAAEHASVGRERRASFSQQLTDDKDALTNAPPPTREKSADGRPSSAGGRPSSAGGRPSSAGSAKSDGLGAPPVARRFSSRSQKVLSSLEVVSGQLDKLEALAQEAVDCLDKMERGVVPIHAPLRNTLAQLHGDCLRLLSLGGKMLSVANAAPVVALDALNTSDIVSAQEDSRRARKALVNRAQAMADMLDAQIARFDRLKGAGAHAQLPAST